MGGTLTAEDTPGGGLTMVVSLPAASPPRARPTCRARRARAVTRVLIVDDDIQLLRALRINLTARGYNVLTAADGRTALRAAADRRPDVVVLDLGLPDLDGTDVIAELRTFTRCRSSCSPRAPTPATRCTPSTAARTTTSPSPSASRS